MNTLTLRSSANLTLILIVLALPARAGLVGHWQFDEGAGTSVTDSSGQGNHGNLVNAGAGTWTTGTSGGALYFDGTTGSGCTRVTIPDAPSLHLTNAISIAAWVRCDDTGRDAPILDKEGDGNLAYWFGTFGPSHFGVLFDSDGNQPWSLYDRDQGTVPQGLWVHLASTWDGATIRHYLNGVQVPETTAFTGPLYASVSSLIIGANVPYNTTAFRGAVDDLRLYSHTLSAENVRALAGTQRLLVGHWSFDEAVGTNIWDRSSQTNHGAIINLQPNTWTTGMSGGALYFDGTVGENSTYVAIPDSPSLRLVGDLTVAAWVRCDDIYRDAPDSGQGRRRPPWLLVRRLRPGQRRRRARQLRSVAGCRRQPALDDECTPPGRDPPGSMGPLGQRARGHRRPPLPQRRPAVHHQQLRRTHPRLRRLRRHRRQLPLQLLLRHTAFLGVVDEVYLYNYALTTDEIRNLRISSAFAITSAAREGNDLRLAWACVPGRSYVVQTNALSSAGAGGFNDASPVITVPAGFTGATTNFLHTGAFLSAPARCYRVKLLP